MYKSHTLILPDHPPTLRFTFPPVSFSISTDCPPAVAPPVPKSSNCLEQRLHTLFAADSSGEYSLHYPVRNLRWGGAVPLGGPMWGNKKPDAAKAGQPAQKNLHNNQPTNPASATW